jgi:protein O-GlcNAc transferase
MPSTADQIEEALALQRRGALADAAARYAEVLRVDPDNSDVNYYLGTMACQEGRFSEGIEFARKSLAGDPRNSRAYVLLGRASSALGRQDEALTCFERAITLTPDLAQAHACRADVLSDLGRLAEAIEGYDKALLLTPEVAEDWVNRGAALYRLGRLEEALASFDKAIEQKPNVAQIHARRANVLLDLGRDNEALAGIDHALRIEPGFADVWLVRGNLFFNRQNYQDASASYEQVLKLAPDSALAWLSYGSALLQLNRYDHAFAAYEKAAALDPELDYALGHGVFAHLNLCKWETLRANTRQLLLGLEEGKNTSMPFALLAIQSTVAEQFRCAELYAKKMVVFSPIWHGELYSHDRIRIAYLSADFHEHPVSHLIAGLFEHHDRARFAVTGLSFGANKDSAMRKRLATAFEHFVDIQSKSDAGIAELIRQLEIDIVVDLMGHTQNARFGILARRPAPTQVHFLGYPGTTGTRFIDYIVADPTVIPKNHFQFYSERVVWLPDSYQANDDRRQISDRKPTRRECGLPDSGFVFCCFNSTYKINPEMFDIWMRLLRALPNSVLWLLGTNPAAEENLRVETERRGVAPGRLIFAPRMRSTDHLARNRCADLFLDTLPYNAHTTASDALWVGLPILTCLGETFAGRVAASLLKAAGLSELITTSLEEYEALALRLAREPTLLAAIKGKLANNRDTCPLFDTARFARHIEAAYTIMWERQQRGELPEGFAVEPLDYQSLSRT